jgi:hypothetical protein
MDAHWVLSAELHLWKQMGQGFHSENTATKEKNHILRKEKGWKQRQRDCASLSSQPGIPEQSEDPGVARDLDARWAARIYDVGCSVNWGQPSLHGQRGLWRGSHSAELPTVIVVTGMRPYVAPKYCHTCLSKLGRTKEKTDTGGSMGTHTFKHI